MCAEGRFCEPRRYSKPNNGMDFSLLFRAVDKAYAVATGVSGKEAVSTIEGDFAVYVELRTSGFWDLV